MLIHKGTVTLETERLILRKFVIEDAEDMFANWANDEMVTKFLSFTPHGSVDTTKQVMAEWTKAYENLDTYNWSIVPKEYGKVIGNITVNDISDKNQRCQIGYIISRAFWNRGIMTEGFKAVINFLFKEVGINRIQAKYDLDNPASGKVMEKVGMKYEGTLKQYKKRKDGTFGNSNIYAITKEEFDQ